MRTMNGIIAGSIGAAILAVSAPVNAQLLSANIGNIGASVGGGYDYGYYSYPSYGYSYPSYSYSYPTYSNYSYTYPTSNYYSTPSYYNYSYSAPAYGYSYPSYNYYSNPGISVGVGF